MRPLDPRLVRHARSTRAFIGASVVLGILGAALTIVSAVLLSKGITEGFQQGRTAAELGPVLLGLLGVVAARVGIAYLADVMAHRSAARAKSELRAALLDHVAALGPGYLIDAERRARISRMATSGVDSLDAYFSRYLPQLFLSVIVPLMVGATILTQDLLAAAILLFTVPLIPLFMVLIGRYTQAKVDRQWSTLDMLSQHFLDVLAGMTTLKSFERASFQVEQVRSVGESYRRTTLGVLRISFLSAVVLELLSTISVAMVAVSIGLRLVHGGMDLRTGLLVLILAPEVYLPLRLVGLNFHAAADGVAAAQQIFEVLEEPLPEWGSAKVRNVAPITLDGVSVTYPGRSEPAVRGLTAQVPRGALTVLSGPSGAGKSTAIGLLLGFVREPFAAVEGDILIDGSPLHGLARDEWLSRVAYVPQMPTLLPGTVADNVRMARSDATDAEVSAALREVGLDAMESQAVGDSVAGVSVGQARRIAVARALLRDADLILLDEPTASLDPESEQAVIRALLARRDAGATILAVAHRSSLADVADLVLHLEALVDHE